MENLTEAQRHLYNILDEELAVMEHPSCSLEEMRSRVVHLVGRLEPYLGCHIDMSQDANLSGVDLASIKGLIHHARSVGIFDAFLHFTSIAISGLMTQEERREFFGEDTR